MPVGNASSRTPKPDSDLNDTFDPWAVPLGRIGGISFSLSYTVFIAAAILVGVVLVVSGPPENTDLPRAAALGTLFWISGWGIQIVTHALLTWMSGLRESAINIGLVGIESSPRSWPPGRTFAISTLTVVSLLFLGAFYRIVDGGFQVPVMAPAEAPTFTAPSIGFAKSDSIWLSAAWLCWVQALFQMCPLPRTQGRQVLTSIVGLSARRLDLGTQEAIVRRCLSLIAIATVMMGIFIATVDEPFYSSNWPLFILLGVLLWVSARAPDLAESLDGFRSVDTLSHAGEPSLQVGADKPGLATRVRESIRERGNRKRLKKAVAQERSEAVDAERLDQILTRLHQDGIEALDSDEREILERVSESLRRRRESEPGESGDGET